MAIPTTAELEQQEAAATAIRVCLQRLNDAIAHALHLELRVDARILTLRELRAGAGIAEQPIIDIDVLRVLRR